MNAMFFGGPKDKQNMEVTSCPPAIYWHGSFWAFNEIAHQHWLATGTQCQGIYYLSIQLQKDALYIWDATE